MPVDKPDFDEIRRFGQTFTTVVNEVVDGLSAEAIGAYVYLMGKPNDWVIRPADVRKRFNWGRHTWMKVAKELREAGVLFDRIDRDDKGRVVKRVLYIGSQSIDSMSLKNEHMESIGLKNEHMESIGPIIGKTAEPTVGKSDPLHNKDSLQNKDKYKGLSLAEVPDDWRGDICEFIDHRKSIKKPLTQQALTRYLNKVRKCIDAGIDPSTAIHTTIDRGWSDINPEWITNIKPKDSAKETNEHYW